MASITVTTPASDFTITKPNSTFTVTTPEAKTIAVGNPATALTVTRQPVDVTVITNGIPTSLVSSVNGQTGAVTLTTTNIAEGTNLYHTPARVRTNISVNDVSGFGSLTYDNTTGVISYVGASSGDVQGAFTAGTGVTISSGTISIGQPVATTDNVTFNAITATGDLRLNGDTIRNSTNDVFVLMTKDINNTKYIEFGGAARDVRLYASGLVLPGDISMGSRTVTLATNAANQVLDQYVLTQRASNYVVQIACNGDYEIWEGMLLHDGTNVFISAYGEIKTDQTLATITADISGSYVRLLATPVNPNTTFRLLKTIFAE